MGGPACCGGGGEDSANAARPSAANDGDWSEASVAFFSSSSILFCRFFAISCGTEGMSRCGFGDINSGPSDCGQYHINDGPSCLPLHSHLMQLGFLGDAVAPFD